MKVGDLVCTELINIWFKSQILFKLNYENAKIKVLKKIC